MALPLFFFFLPKILGQREWGPRHKPGLDQLKYGNKAAHITLTLRDFRKIVELSMCELTTGWILEKCPKSRVCTYHNMDFRKNAEPSMCKITTEWILESAQSFSVCTYIYILVTFVMITYNIYIVIRETGQFSSKGIINDFIGNLNRLTVSRRFTEQAV